MAGINEQIMLRMRRLYLMDRGEIELLYLKAHGDSTLLQAKDLMIDEILEAEFGPKAIDNYYEYLKRSEL